MPKVVIEREIPGAGKLSPQELQGVSQKSCRVLRELSPQIQWVQSYVTDDKIYCIYIAPDEETIRKHAQMGGFPANKNLPSSLYHRSHNVRVNAGRMSPWVNVESEVPGCLTRRQLQLRIHITFKKQTPAVFLASIYSGVKTLSIYGG
jgi:hypothetical protein